MIELKHAGLAVVLLLIGTVSHAQEGVPYDVVPDEAKGPQAGVFHAPTRNWSLAAARDRRCIIFVLSRMGGGRVEISRPDSGAGNGSRHEC